MEGAGQDATLRGKGEGQNVDVMNGDAVASAMKAVTTTSAVVAVAEYMWRGRTAVTVTTTEAATSV